MISVYSTLSAVLFFNISMLAVYLLRRKNGFLAAYTAPVLRFLTLLGAVRLFLPLTWRKPGSLLCRSCFPSCMSFCTFPLFRAY